ncbi:PREDICTED: NAC domain-containing protein 43-like [Nelumbo nucifera]|uniref:NAC domain-containing protein 43-like n=2 Tax=Nelumbo nucifera TaxID=4432 RepID=A0A1U8AI92_NELNU|nr:PREDICTED: NAC domain-containing protein 43-like [Nelumbo nucifera]DAD18041.1 TPA_asm: hypothetical protein HUJ06_019504 [Nelumbo nucifera]
MSEPEDMSLSVNGQSQVPPGFRFHPTEEELLHYYLRKKVAYEKIDLDVIRDVDLNKLEPWDIQEKCKIGSTPQNDWYFFSHKDKKYPTGTRTNRATAAGFWKATGRDKVIYSSFKQIGMRKTLVFYKGRAPHGQISDWIMYEYRLDDRTATTDTNVNEEGWVVCRIFRKKNHHKSIEAKRSSSVVTVDANTHTVNTSRDVALDQILQYMGRNCKQENETGNTTTSTDRNNTRFPRPTEIAINNDLQERISQLPALESPTLLSLRKDSIRLDDIQSCSSQVCYQPIQDLHQVFTDDSETSATDQVCGNTNPIYHAESGLSDWTTLDRLLAHHYHLIGQAETCKHLPFFTKDSSMAFGSDPLHLQLRDSNTSSSYHNSQDSSSENDPWSITRSCYLSTDPPHHVSNA